jgi:hypothetical protein
LFFLPISELKVGSTWIGCTPAQWDANYTNDSDTGPYHKDWVRTQPTGIGGTNVRNLYWLRVYDADEDHAYSTAPRELTMNRYQPDPRSWLDMCNEIYDAVKDADPNAKVFNSGLGFYGNSYLNGDNIDRYKNTLYWYYLKSNTYNTKWDGVVIHPYTYAATGNQIVTMVDDSTNGLLKQIDNMHDILSDASLGSKEIAATEWANLNDYKGEEQILANALYCLDGTLTMVYRTDGKDSVNYAAWHALKPPHYQQYSAFYTYPEMPWGTSISTTPYPDANTLYVQRPIGLAMEMAAKYYRNTGHTVTRSLGGGSCKAFSFSETGKTSTTVLINPSGSDKTLSLCWPAVAGKNIYVSYLRTKSGYTPNLNNDNEDVSNYPSNLEVELTENTDSGQDVPANGTFELTIPMYSAVGIEFRD